MTVNYYLDDFYDFPTDADKKAGFVNSLELKRLHEVRLAKEFRVVGQYKSISKIR